MRRALRAFAAVRRSRRRPDSPLRSTVVASSLSEPIHLHRCYPKFQSHRFPSWEPTASGCGHCRGSRRNWQTPGLHLVRWARTFSRASPKSWGTGLGYSLRGDRAVSLPGCTSRGLVLRFRLRRPLQEFDSSWHSTVSVQAARLHASNIGISGPEL
jgi:hypothetical protein